MTLRGAGLGINSTVGQTALNTTQYFGIQMDGIENLELHLSNNGADSFTVDDEYNPDGSLAAKLKLTIYGGDGNDAILVKSISDATAVVGGNGDDTVTVQAPGNKLTSILGRLTVDGNNDLVRTSVSVNDNDPSLLVQQFLSQNTIVVATGNLLTASDGTRYYRAAFVPILVDTSGTVGSPLSVRTVVLDSKGDMVQLLVQQQGVPEYGVRAYGRQKKDLDGNPLFLEDDGTGTGGLTETRTNTGVMAIEYLPKTATGALELFYDTSGNVTTDGTLTGLPAITPATSTTTDAAPVYVDSAFRHVFSLYGPNLLTNGNFSDQVPTNGFANGWTSVNIDGNGGWRYWAGNPIIVFNGRWYEWNPGFILNDAGQGGTDPTIRQTLTNLAVGVTYEVTGDFASIWSNYGNRDAFSFAVQVDGITIFSARRSRDANGNLVNDVWRSFRSTFTATKDTAVLSISGERNGDDSSYMIDNLSVREIHVQAYLPDFDPTHHPSTSGSTMPAAR